MTNDQQVNGNSKTIKFRFYFMSLWLLFVLIFLLTVDIPISFSKDSNFIGLSPLLERNWLALLSLSLAILGLCIAAREEYRWRGVTNLPYKIESIKNCNYEYLTFLTTYIIPLICMDLTKVRYVLVLFILLLIIGLIFIKMDLYCGNPTLALMGYKLYRAKIKGLNSPEGVILISKDQLSQGSSIKWIRIDNLVWIAKEIKE